MALKDDSVHLRVLHNILLEVTKASVTQVTIPKKKLRQIDLELFSSG